MSDHIGEINEMVFPDEDLKRWKNLTSGSRMPPFFELQALLARLEAAENAIWKMIELDDSIALGSSSDCDTHNRMVDEAKSAMDAWRKVAGK